MKKFFKIYIPGFLGFILTYLIYKTIKWNVVYLDDKEKFPSRAVATFWHSNLLLMAPIAAKCVLEPTRSKATVLISRYNDGRIIANVIKYYKMDSVAGSSSRNAKGASKSLLKKLENEKTIAVITPDGPKGPKETAKTGAVVLASLSKTPIIPIAVDFKDKWVFGSWDKMFLAKPFTKGAFVVGRYITVKENLSDKEREEARKELEFELNKTCNVAKRSV